MSMDLNAIPSVQWAPLANLIPLTVNDATFPALSVIRWDQTLTPAVSFQEVYPRYVNICYSIDKTSAGSSTSSVVSAAGTVLNANPARIIATIQNLGVNPLFVKKGAGASATSFSFILAGAVANYDGTGGSIAINPFNGVVSVSGASPLCVISEDTL